jgi:diguanylate cyclase (GGDEF)-like protein/PAS domain S-box-containing protein
LDVETLSVRVLRANANNMLKLLGYDVLAQIYESVNSQVYRAIRRVDSQPVILKVLKENYPTPSELIRYKQEYELTHTLNLEGVIKAYSLEKHNNSFVIVFEDFGGESLMFLTHNYQFSLVEFLSISLKITSSLGQLHATRIIHKDINPANIVYHPKNQQLKIIDFGISTRLTRENPTLKNPNVLEGTLAYISPEQTGRMNRSLDYRTDFYSLGVTFYELLTGKLPFETDDYLELVHCHLAKQPLSPSEINRSIPPIISDIVLKLMAKNAEERYQSAWGLEADLETCLNQLQLTQKIENFPLARQDVSEQLQIPQKLYGRNPEIEALIAAFERVSNPVSEQQRHSEMMLIAGYSGIGKSVLVQEIYKPITEKRGYFISGKFDQFQRNIPYSAIVSALQELIYQILTESDSQLQQWKNKLLTALGENGQVIIDVIPELELIIGKQPPVPELGPNESQNRFNLVFQNFIHVFCAEDHPLVIFLDDLQWADGATLKLIELMITDINLQYLFLIGAYRNNEVSPAHPLSLTINELRKKQVIITQLTLNNLGRVEISQLIAETLGSSLDKVKVLADLVLKKTRGNPFFVKQFINTLYTKNLIKFANHQQKWQWDVEQIKKQNITEKVVELMIVELQSLPEDTQEILQLAACIGTHFDLQTLSIISEKSPKEVCRNLIVAVESGLILPLSELDEELLIEDYQFIHDSVQHAAYSLIAKEQKYLTHYHIGQQLLHKISPEEKLLRIFELVNQLNYAKTLITQQTERDQLAELNLIACRKARATSAYQAGLEYASVGLSLLGENPWTREYKMTLEFHELGAELALLGGDFEAMEQFIEVVIANTRTLLEQVKVYLIKITSNVSQNNLPDAVTIAQNFLQQLGVTFPETPTENDIQQAIAEINQLIADWEIEDLVHLPTMIDEEKIAIVKITSSITPAAYLCGSPLYPLLVVLPVKLSIQYGNILASASAYATYSIIASNFLQDINTAVKFGQLALQLVFQQDAKAVKPEVLLLVATFILHRESHIKETLSLLQEGYVTALEVGNHDMAGHNAHCCCLNSFWSSQPLADLEEQISTYFHKLAQLNLLTTANYCRIYSQSIFNLLGVGKHPTVLSGQALEETDFLPQQIEEHDLYGLYIFYVYKLMLCYLFEEFESAQNHAVEARRYLISGIGTVAEPAFYFYDALTTLAELSLDSEEITEALEQVEQIITQLQQQWADHAPMNYQHKVDLLAAEKCRILGHKIEAMELYDKAIAGAKENEYIQEEALANELAAKFYQDWGKPKIAGTYMSDAYYCYLRWGAKAKTDQLEAKYPQLLAPILNFMPPKTSPQNVYTVATNNSFLDFASAIKASQTLSQEIELDALLFKLMHILIENAGANAGSLILNNSGTWEIAAQWVNHHCQLSTIPLDQITALPSSIINTVKRTQQTLIVNNPEEDKTFATDPYLIQQSPRSLCCLPILNQRKLIGILYLENHLAPGAFTTERVEILNLLSFQVAISIENAKLYAEVRENESRLGQFINGMPVGVCILDASGQPYYTNHVAKKLLGKGVVDIASSDKIPEVYQFYRAGTNEIYPSLNLPGVRALHGETTRAEDIELHKENRIIPIEAWGKPVYNERGEIKYAIAAFQDITERKQAEKILADYNQILKQQVAERTAELQKANQELSRLANLDGLTQLANRRRFDEYLAAEWQRHLREQQYLSLILIDIDYFKRYNDHYGHQGGDDCLIRVAQILANIPQRPTDLVARYGGEEFVVVLPHTNREGALTVANSIQQTIASFCIPHACSEVSQFVTLSIGVSSLIPTPEASLEDLIARTDEALYEAKNQGRNCIRIASSSGH